MLNSRGEVTQKSLFDTTRKRKSFVFRCNATPLEMQREKELWKIVANCRVITSEIV
jgi:hypothetical protein